MARQRNYEEEYNRRNIKANKIGYENYPNLRKALEEGKARRINGKVVATPTNSKFPKGTPAYKRAGAKSPKEFMKMKNDTKEWIKKHSRVARSSLSAEEINQPEIMGPFYRAYVAKGQRDMHTFLVDVSHRISQKNWEKNYAKRFNR